MVHDFVGYLHSIRGSVLSIYEWITFFGISDVLGNVSEFWHISSEKYRNLLSLIGLGF